MSHDNSFLLNEFVAKLLGNAAALPFTVPMYALGGAMKATGSTVSQGVKSTGEVATATRRAATDTVGLTKTEAAKKAEAEAKIEKERAEIETQKLKDAETPEETQNMKKSIKPLNAHLNQGSFDSFLYEVLSESSAARRKITKAAQNAANIPGSSQNRSARRNSQLAQAGGDRSNVGGEVGDKVRTRRELNKSTSTPTRTQKLAKFKADKARFSGGDNTANTAKAEEKTTATAAPTATTKTTATAAPTATAKKKWTPGPATAKPLTGKARMRASSSYKAGKAELQGAQNTAFASTERSKGFTLKSRGRKTGEMEGKAEGERMSGQMNARKKAVEGGLARRALRRVTPGATGRFEKKLARYGPGSGAATGNKQQQQSGIPTDGSQAEKKSVLNKSISLGDCQRGSLDLLV